MERWSGRVALVTGASVGIGAAICRKLVAAGMKVVGAARSLDKMKSLAEELSDQPGSLTPMKCDVTKDDQVLTLFSDIKQQFGGVDVCINNAGMSHYTSLLEGTPEEWREMMDTNVVALCLCTREAVASMRHRGVDDGHIIHISSVCSFYVFPMAELHFYCGTKHAVKALTEGLRQELRDAKSHIRVTSISPAVVETDFLPRMMKDEEKAEELYRSAEYLKPEDVASSVIHALAAPPRVQVHDIVVYATEEKLTVPLCS